MKKFRLFPFLISRKTPYIFLCVKKGLIPPKNGIGTTAMVILFSHLHGKSMARIYMPLYFFSPDIEHCMDNTVKFLVTNLDLNFEFRAKDMF